MLTTTPTLSVNTSARPNEERVHVPSAVVLLALCGAVWLMGCSGCDWIARGRTDTVSAAPGTRHLNAPKTIRYHRASVNFQNWDMEAWTCEPYYYRNQPIDIGLWLSCAGDTLAAPLEIMATFQIRKSESSSVIFTVSRRLTLERNTAGTWGPTMVPDALEFCPGSSNSRMVDVGAYDVRIQISVNQGTSLTLDLKSLQVRYAPY